MARNRDGFVGSLLLGLSPHNGMVHGGQLRHDSLPGHRIRIPKDHSWFVAAEVHVAHRTTGAAAGSNGVANRSLVVRCVVAMDGLESRESRLQMLIQMDQCPRGRRAARNVRRPPRRPVTRCTRVRGIDDCLDAKDAPLLPNNWLS